MYIRISLLVFIFFGCETRWRKNISSEELNVYKVITDSIIVNQREIYGDKAWLIIGDSTYISNYNPSTIYSQLRKENINDYDIVEDCKNKDKITVSLKTLKGINTKLSLLNKKECNYSVSSKSDISNKGYEKYRYSSDLLYFSRVGFNKDSTIAILRLISRCGDLCGLDECILLEKMNNKWIIKRKDALGQF